MDHSAAISVVEKDTLVETVENPDHGPMSATGHQRYQVTSRGSGKLQFSDVRGRHSASGVQGVQSWSPQDENSGCGREMSLVDIKGDKISDKMRLSNKPKISHRKEN